MDLKTLFSKLTEVAVHGAFAASGRQDSVPSFVSSILQTSEAITLNTPLDARAWRLVYGALTGAMREIIDEFLSDRPPFDGDIDHLMTGVELRIGQQDVKLTPDLFRNPTTLSLLQPLQTHFRDWLVLVGLQPKEAASISGRLPPYFTAALHDEWRRSSEEYAPLLQALETPFSPAVQLEEDWSRYRTFLSKQIAQPVLGEAFSLSQIYIPLRGFYLDHVSVNDDSVLDSPDFAEHPSLPRGVEKKHRRVVVDLSTEIDEWLRSGHPDDTIRLLSGGPGSGKSSFARMLAAHLTDTTCRVLYFPLQRFLVSERLAMAIGTYLQNTGAFRSNPLEQLSFASRDHKLLLIFDGLDELTKPGEVSESEARRFLGELRTTIGQWNYEACRVLALVTGRTISIQATREVIRPADRQELHVLKYYVDEASRHQFYDPQRLLEADRLEWWDKYSSLKDGEPTQIPSILLSGDVEDLTSEPLLNYLFVLSGYHQTELQTTSINRNEIYKRLFTGVQDRKYEREPLAIRQELKDEFEELMETVATAAWYGDGRTATVDDVRRQCPDRLRQTLDRLVKGGGGINRLIAAFYFQAAEQTSRYLPESFEFTHKSFGEYLTARRIVRKIREIHENLSFQRDFYGDRQALNDWFSLCHLQPLEMELQRFLFDELQMLEWKAYLGAWQDMLRRLMGLCVREGPVAPTQQVDTFRRLEHLGRNAEETLIAALSGCTRATGSLAHIEWADAHSAGMLIHRLRGQRYMLRSSVVLRSMSYISFAGQNFIDQDLFGADMFGSDLSGADLYRADIREATFDYAILRKTQLSNATVDRASFRHADLENAELNGIQYSQTFMRHLDDESTSDRTYRSFVQPVDFSDANLKGSSLISASLYRASFENANLENADLQFALLPEVNFRGANLRGAKLRGANLWNAELSEDQRAVADLTGANFDPLNTEVYGFDEINDPTAERSNDQ